MAHSRNQLSRNACSLGRPRARLARRVPSRANHSFRRGVGRPGPFGFLGGRDAQWAATSTQYPWQAQASEPAQGETVRVLLALVQNAPITADAVSLPSIQIRIWIRFAAPSSDTSRSVMFLLLQKALKSASNVAQSPITSTISPGRSENISVSSRKVGKGHFRPRTSMVRTLAVFTVSVIESSIPCCRRRFRTADAGSLRVIFKYCYVIPYSPERFAGIASTWPKRNTNRLRVSNYGSNGPPDEREGPPRFSPQLPARASRLLGLAVCACDDPAYETLMFSRHDQPREQARRQDQANPPFLSVTHPASLPITSVRRDFVVPLRRYRSGRSATPNVWSPRSRWRLSQGCAFSKTIVRGSDKSSSGIRAGVYEMIVEPAPPAST
jgi:hypothetical protein